MSSWISQRLGGAHPSRALRLLERSHGSGFKLNNDAGHVISAYTS